MSKVYKISPSMMDPEGLIPSVLVTVTACSQPAPEDAIELPADIAKQLYIEQREIL